MNEFDTNINLYTYDELFDIIELPNDSDKETINNKINSIIDKLDSDDSNNEILITFLENIKNKLFIRVDLDNINDNNINDLLPDKDRKIIDRNLRTKIPNSVPLEIAQDKLNPNLRQTTSKIVLLDSSQRKDKVPYKNDPYHKSSATSYSCNLSMSLKNVIKIRLASFYIPDSFYTFNKITGNTFFTIKKLTNESWYNIEITEKNYETFENLKNEIQDKIEEKIPSLDISFILENDKFKFKNNSSDISYEIIFYDNNNDYSGNPIFDKKYNTNNNNNNITYENCLGYYLGFRSNANNNYDINDLINKWCIQLDVSSNNSETSNNNETSINEILAEAKADLIGPTYFKIVVTDYNKNESASNLVNIQNMDNTLNLPKYINKINRDIYENDIDNYAYKDLDNISYRLYTVLDSRSLNDNNRNIYTLNQKQIYALNEIIITNKQKKKRNNKIVNNNDVLAIVYTEDIKKKNFKLNDRLFEKNFFGPVLIDKLKVELYDSIDNLVNLNGLDWNISLIVDELYQY